MLKSAGRAWAAALLIMLNLAWIAPHASAQLSLPGGSLTGSLIVTLTSPNSGATVRDTIPVSASVGIVGSLTVSRVEFFADGNFIGSDFGSPYSVFWDTTRVSNGSYTLNAVAVDVLGVRWTSNSVTVNVSNVSPPTISGFSPTSGGVGTTVDITGNNFSGASAARFNGAGANFTVSSSTLIRATVPSGATSGPISVTTPGGTATSTSSFTVTTSTSATRSEETAVTFSGTGWTTRGPEIAAFSGGTAVSTEVGGDAASFTFTGTGVSWIGLKCNICGVAIVSIDGGTPISVDTAGTAAVGTGAPSEVVFTSPPLAAGTHTLVITVTGGTNSGGAHIIVDAFDVTGGTGSDVTRIEDTDPSVSYVGTWSVFDDPRASGGTIVEAFDDGAQATLTFTGTAVSWIGAKGTFGGKAKVFVNGEFKEEVDTFADCGTVACEPGPAGAPDAQAQVVLFTASGLDPTVSHTLTIAATGDKNPAATDTGIIVDAFDVTP